MWLRGESSALAALLLVLVKAVGNCIDLSLLGGRACAFFHRYVRRSVEVALTRGFATLWSRSLLLFSGLLVSNMRAVGWEMN